MGNLKQKYGISFLFSVVVHLVLILLLVISVQTHVKTRSTVDPADDIIQATVMDEKQISALVKAPESQNSEKNPEKKPEEPKVETAKPLNPPVSQALPAQELEQTKAKQQKQALEKSKEVEEAALATLRLEKEKEQKAIEALKKEKAKEEKRLQAIDEKRQEEQERATQMRLEREKEEKKKKDLLEAKRKIEEDKKAAALKAQEEARIAAENAARQQMAQGEFRKYEGIIKDKVKGSWVRPSGLPAQLQCKLEIHAMPDGDVVSVKVIRSSGNEAFDQSAIAAVQKAVPLPFPQGEPEVMNLFRNFTFEFIPDENSEVSNNEM